MASMRSTVVNAPSALRAEFDVELHRLANQASRNGCSQGVMRLRALAEIAAVLSTDALLDLVVAVHVTSDRSGAGDLAN